jgi:hypothetical protein
MDWIHTAEDNDQWLSVLNTIIKYKIFPLLSKASRRQDEW